MGDEPASIVEAAEDVAGGSLSMGFGLRKLRGTPSQALIIRKPDKRAREFVCFSGL